MILNNGLNGVKKILIFNPSFIGDAILTTPLITAVAKLFPQAEIAFCVRPESAPLFDGLCYNNKPLKVLPFDKRGDMGGIAGLFKFARTIRQMNFDMVITPHKSLRSLLLLKLAKIKHRIGFKESTGAFLLTDSVHRQMALHEVVRNLILLTPLVDSTNGIQMFAGGLQTYLDTGYCNKLKAELRQGEQDKIIGINAGSVWATKRWPIEYFATLAVGLHNNGFSILLLGGPGDADVTNALKDILNENEVPYLDFCAKVPFSKIPAVIKSLDLLVTNDSAPLHIAVSQGVPTVAIFGATVPSLGFAPYDDASIICENDGLPCRPCGLHGGMRCPEGHFNCMLGISPEVVFAAVKSAHRMWARYRETRSDSDD